eukprot:Colp12_sorted_trinity150504_noHs@18534
MPTKQPIITPPVASTLCQHDLEEMFTDIGKVNHDPAKPHGLLKGNVLGVFGAEVLPTPLRGTFHQVVNFFSAPIWRGFKFSENEGTNVFVKEEGGIQFGKFSVSVDNADDGKVVKLDYNVQDNLFPLRLFSGELRQVDEDNTYLGRLNINLFHKKLPLMYFTLQPSEESIETSAADGTRDSSAPDMGRRNSFPRRDSFSKERRSSAAASVAARSEE